MSQLLYIFIYATHNCAFRLFYFNFNSFLAGFYIDCILRDFQIEPMQSGNVKQKKQNNHPKVPSVTINNLKAIILSILTLWRYIQFEVLTFSLCFRMHLSAAKSLPRVTWTKVWAHIVYKGTLLLPSVRFVEPRKKQQGPKTKLLLAGREWRRVQATTSGGGAGAQGQCLASFA